MDEDSWGLGARNDAQLTDLKCMRILNRARDRIADAKVTECVLRTLLLEVLDCKAAILETLGEHGRVPYVMEVAARIRKARDPEAWATRFNIFLLRGKVCQFLCHLIWDMRHICPKIKALSHECLNAFKRTNTALICRQNKLEKLAIDLYEGALAQLWDGGSTKSVSVTALKSIRNFCGYIGDDQWLKSYCESFLKSNGQKEVATEDVIKDLKNRGRRESSTVLRNVMMYMVYHGYAYLAFEPFGYIFPRLSLRANAVKIKNVEGVFTSDIFYWYRWYIIWRKKFYLSDGKWMRPIEGFLYLNDVGQPFLGKPILRPRGERLCRVMHRSWTLYRACIDLQSIESALGVLGYYSECMRGVRALRDDVIDKCTRKLCMNMKEPDLVEVDDFMQQDPHISRVTDVCSGVWMIAAELSRILEPGTETEQTSKVIAGAIHEKIRADCVSPAHKVRIPIGPKSSGRTLKLKVFCPDPQDNDSEFLWFRTECAEGVRTFSTLRSCCEYIAGKRQEAGGSDVTGILALYMGHVQRIMALGLVVRTPEGRYKYPKLSLAGHLSTYRILMFEHMYLGNSGGNEATQLLPCAVHGAAGCAASRCGRCGRRNTSSSTDADADADADADDSIGRVGNNALVPLQQLQADLRERPSKCQCVASPLLCSMECMEESLCSCGHPISSCKHGIWYNARFYGPHALRQMLNKYTEEAQTRHS